MTKVLTVLIPTFNNYSLFKKVINAYLDDPRVIIFVSDDSDDFNEKKLIELACKNYNIRYFDGPKREASYNWNFLLQKINTPFFVLNHHDEYPSNLKFLDALDLNNLGLVILPCTSSICDKASRKIFSWQQKYFSRICLLWPNASFNMILAPTASLIVKSDFKNILFDCNLKWFVDADWYQKLFNESLRKKNKIVYFPNSRIISYQAKNSISSSLKKILRDQIKQEKNYLRKKKLVPKRIFVFLQIIFLSFIIFQSKLRQSFNFVVKKDKFTNI